MRVAVALTSETGPFHAGGDCPDIRLWDESGEKLGEKMNPGWIEDGDFRDVVIDQLGKHQPTYALLSANKNGMCIAYLQQTWPDQQEYVWIGNWGETCGYPWYYSNIIHDGKPLLCTWIDADRTIDTNVTGLGIHFPKFTDIGQNKSEDPAYYCSNKATLEFHIEANPGQITVYYPPTRPEYAGNAETMESGEERRSVHSPRGEPVDAPNSTQLVKSNLAPLSATYLCQSTTSKGPDFVSFDEDKYCDMQKKELWPLCKSNEDTNCFDTEADDFRILQRLGKRAVSSLAGVKSYSNVTIWG